MRTESEPAVDMPPTHVPSHVSHWTGRSINLAWEPNDGVTDTRPVVQVCHDESCFFSKEFNPSTWHHEDVTQFKKKSKGTGAH